MNLQNKKFYLVSSAVVLAGLVFGATASPIEAAGLSSVALAKEVGCSNNEVGLSFSAFLNPLASLVEKVAKDFGFNVALATAPDPDTCGSDNAYCSGNQPAVDIFWTNAPWNPIAVGPNSYLDYYFLAVSGVGTSLRTEENTTSYTVSGLANNTTYSWQVQAYYCYQDLDTGGYYCNVASPYPSGNRPHGSFTTPSCCPPSCPDWSTIPCVGSCGTGTQTRTCTRADCSTYTETQSCSLPPCCNPVDGGHEFYRTIANSSIVAWYDGSSWQQMTMLMEHGVCKKVINSGGNSYFIPTKTWGEWAGFISAVEGGRVPGVSLAPCCP